MKTCVIKSLNTKWLMCLLHFFRSILPLLVWFVFLTPSWAQENIDINTSDSSKIKLSSEELAYIKANPVIRVHAESNWPPYNFIENGDVKGFSNDFILRIASKLGLKVEFISGYSWDEFMAMLANGGIDLISNMKITENRKTFALFSEHSVFDVLNALLGKKGKRQFTQLKQLKGKNLAVVRGYFHEELLKENYPEINLLLTTNTLEAMKQVELGNAEAAIETHAVFNDYIKRYFFTDLISRPLINDPTFPSAPQHLGIRKDRPLLKSILDKAMAAVTEQELQELRHKWLLVSRTAIAKFTSSEADYLQRKSQITMCVDPDLLPLEAIKNGRHVGMSSEVIKLLQESIGIPVSLVETENWSESVEYAKKRRCDILSLVIETPDQKSYLNFTHSYLKLPLVAVTRDDESFIGDISTVNDQKFGIVRDYAFGELLRIYYPAMQIVEVESVIDGLSRVNQGELFGFIDTLPSVSYAIQRNYPSLKIAGSFDHTWDIGVGVRNDEPELLSVFNKAIASIDPITLQKIINDSISVKYEKGIDYTLVWSISLICFVFFILIGTYSWHVKKINLLISKKNEELTTIMTKLESKNKELEIALDKIQTLQGILPFCSFCKKIRNDKGYWEQVDVYISKYSKVDISHGICPECMKEHYPEII